MSKDELWKKYKETNDLLYKQELIKEYISLVKIVAGRMYNFYGGNVEFEDLLSYGIFGLIDSIDKFELQRDLKFETYAHIRIRGAIIDNLRKIDWIPRALRKKSKEYERIIGKLENKLGRSITVNDISNELNIPVSEVEKELTQISTFNMVSLEELLSTKGEPNTINQSKDNPEISYQEKEIKYLLKEGIDHLPEKEKIVISLYYYNELTYKEIGQVLSLSESRISQLHSKAILTIKNYLRKSDWAI